MKDMYVRTISAAERFTPPLLRDFLVNLEATETSEDVWHLLVGFGEDLGLSVVEYIHATDYRDFEKAQFIRTTTDSSWLGYVKEDPEVRKNSLFRQHSVKYLTPSVCGLAYIDELPNMSEKRRSQIARNVDFGLSAGIVFPLRMNEPGQAGHVLFGGLFTKDEFDAILDQHGWAMNGVAAAGHSRYIELFKSEFCDRNGLTDKQKELMLLVGRGLLDKQIAHELGISFSAVRQRLASVQLKTGSSNRAELAALAMRIGMVPDPMLKLHDDDLTVFLSMGDGVMGIETQNYKEAAE